MNVGRDTPQLIGQRRAADAVSDRRGTVDIADPDPDGQAVARAGGQIADVVGRLREIVFETIEAVVSVLDPD